MAGPRRRRRRTGPRACPRRAPCGRSSRPGRRRAPELLLDAVHDHRRVGGDGAGVVGDQEGAALASGSSRGPPTRPGTTSSRPARRARGPAAGCARTGPTRRRRTGEGPPGPRRPRRDADRDDGGGPVLLADYLAPARHRAMVPIRSGRPRPVAAAELGAGGPDQAVGEDGGVRDGGAGERRLDHGVGAVGPRARVHHDVVHLVVAVQVVIEEQVTGLEGVERHVGQRRPLRLGRPGDGHPGLGPRPLDEPRAVEADPGLSPPKT